MLKKTSLLILLGCIVLAGCGIEGIQTIPELNPPLGLTTTLTTNNAILVRFWSSNPEQFLTGFNVYVADSEETLRQNLGSLMPNTENDPDKPTLWRNVSPSSNAVLYQVVFSQNYNLQPFENNLTYHFYVRAYSQEYNLKSPPSNIASVKYTNS